MFLRLNDCKFIESDKWNCLELARRFISGALGHRKASRYPESLLCGAAGINAVAVAVSVREDDSMLVQKYLDSFEHGFAASMSNEWDEVLVGRAGFIGACNYLNEITSPPIFENDTRMKDIANEIITNGIRNSKETNFPLMYSYHGTEYLGAAHGIVGILHALLQMWFGNGGQKKVDEIPQTNLDLVWKSIDALIGMAFVTLRICIFLYKPYI